MTNKEAINMLKSKLDGHTDTSYEWVKTVRMAIKALEQKSCKSDAKRWKKRYLDLEQRISKLEKQQPCEDCISREEAIRVAEQGQIQGYEWQFKKLCNLPSVTPQRPKGRWIYSKYHTWICSVCGENTLKYTGVVPSEEKMKKRWRYCSICGAEMEGEDKNEI